jgi:hypothetical protein
MLMDGPGERRGRGATFSGRIYNCVEETGTNALDTSLADYDT